MLSIFALAFGCSTPTLTERTVSEPISHTTATNTSVREEAPEEVRRATAYAPIVHENGLRLVLSTTVDSNVGEGEVRTLPNRTEYVEAVRRVNSARLPAGFSSLERQRWVLYEGTTRVCEAETGALELFARAGTVDENEPSSVAPPAFGEGLLWLTTPLRVLQGDCSRAQWGRAAAHARTEFLTRVPVSAWVERAALAALRETEEWREVQRNHEEARASSTEPLPATWEELDSPVRVVQELRDGNGARWIYVSVSAGGVCGEPGGQVAMFARVYEDARGVRFADRHQAIPAGEAVGAAYLDEGDVPALLFGNTVHRWSEDGEAVAESLPSPWGDCAC